VTGASMLFDLHLAAADDGTYSSNGDRNYDQIGGSLRGSYDLMPGIKPFFQVDSDERVHDITVDKTGAMRDSDGQIFKAGTSFFFAGSSPAKSRSAARNANTATRPCRRWPGRWWTARCCTSRRR